MPARSKTSSALAFVDTNILLYAHDASAGIKQAKASDLLRSLWESRQGALSAQVLQEFFVNATRKLNPPHSISRAREIIRTYSLWVRSDTSAADVIRATELAELTSFSFWDSLILASAEAVGADVLYSEDLQHGQFVAGIEICNPFQK